MNKKDIINKLIVLRNAIVIAHSEKHTTIDVKINVEDPDETRLTWDPSSDSEWQAYKRARQEISKYPWLEKLLLLAKVI